MVLVSHKYQFIYFKNYRAAGSSVEAFFGQFCVDPSIPYVFTDKIDESITQYGIISSRMMTPNNTGYIDKIKEYKKYKRQLHNSNTMDTVIPDCETMWYNYKDSLNVKEDLGENIYNQYTKFCVIRNPYDVVVSSYIYDTTILKTNTDNFIDYCKKLCNILLNDSSYNDESRIFLNEKSACNYYIRYENLKEDIQMVLDKLGIIGYSLDNLPHHKNSGRTDTYQTYYNDDTKALVYSVYKKVIDFFNYTF